MTISSLSSSQSNYYFSSTPDAVSDVVDAALILSADATPAVDAALTFTSTVDADLTPLVDAAPAQYSTTGLSTIVAASIVDAVPIFIPPPPTLPHDTLLLSAQTSIDYSTFDYGLEVIRVETCEEALSSEGVQPLIEQVSMMSNKDDSSFVYPLSTQTDSGNSVEILSAFTPSNSSESSSSLDDSSSSTMITAPGTEKQHAKKKRVRLSEALNTMILETIVDPTDKNARKQAFEAVRNHPDAQGKNITSKNFHFRVNNLLQRKKTQKKIEYTLEAFKLYMSEMPPARGRKKDALSKFSWGDNKRIVELFHQIIERVFPDGKPTSTVIWEREAFEIMKQDQTFKNKDINLHEFIKHFDYLKRKATYNKERIIINGYRYGCIRWVKGQEEACQGEYLLLNLEFNTKSLIKKTQEAGMKSPELRKRKDSSENPKSPLEISEDVNKRHCAESSELTSKI